MVKQIGCTNKLRSSLLSSTIILMAQLLTSCSTESCAITEQDSLLNVSANFTIIQMIAPNEGWATGKGYQMLHYKDGIWSAFKNYKDRSMRGMSMFVNGKGWAVGQQGQILHYQSKCWEANDSFVLSPSSSDGPVLSDVQMLSENEGWIVGNSGFVASYQNGNWQRLRMPEGFEFINFYATYMISSQEGWIVGSNSNIAHFKGTG